MTKQMHMHMRTPGRRRRLYGRHVHKCCKRGQLYESVVFLYKRQPDLNSYYRVAIRRQVAILKVNVYRNVDK